MSVTIDQDRIVLSHHAGVEDAELLLAALIDHPTHSLDISGLAHAHLGVVQLLHAARRPIVGAPVDAFAGRILFKDGQFDSGRAVSDL